MTTENIAGLRRQFDTVAYIIAEQLSAANRHVVSLVAKWRPQDLVPGLSDLDFRIICDDDTSADDWVAIDRALGPIHLKLVSDHPEFNRINEHTAGAGMTISEVLDARFHNPEYAVWHVWWGRKDWMERLQSRLAARPFDAIDEHYHLTKFLGYYSPYIHGIDPPINLGRFEPKYPLHSRCWHYFAPAMVSAASLLARKNIAGKAEALRWLRDRGYVVRQAEAVLGQLDAHYETPELHSPSKLESFESFLFDGFQAMLPLVRHSASRLLRDPSINPTEFKQQIKKMGAADPLAEFMEIVRFARIRACRYYFYLNAPSRFDASLQMVAELNWIRKLTHDAAVALGAVLGNRGLNLTESLRQLDVEITDHQSDAMRHVFAMADLRAGDPTASDMFRKAVELTPPYYRLLESALAAISRGGANVTASVRR